MRIDLSRPSRIHVVGVGGAGMGAIATVLAEMGHTVSGSDLNDSAAAGLARSAGVDVRIGHDAANVGSVDAVTISTAVPATNPEVVAAHQRGIPVLSRAEVLGSLTAVRPALAVAGTHGKTTTSSMLAVLLASADLDPSFVIGGDIAQLGGGAHWGTGEWFVVEADESDGTFVELDRRAAVVTNVEPDHLEHYGGYAGLRDAFAEFLAGTDGPVVVCADDPEAAALAAGASVLTYGTSEGATFRLDVLDERGDGLTFALARAGERLVEVALPMPGLHNARNAAGAAALALELGVPAEAVARGLAGFGGVGRRFEHRGSAAGVTFVDDYAHLPGEVEAALAAAAAGQWRRIVCVFQPHRYSRTQALWRDFATSFDRADLLVVTDIYSSGEAPRAGVTGKLVLDAALSHRPWRRTAWTPTRADLITYLKAELREGDLCLTLGAGDLTTLPDELRAELGSR